MKLLPILALVMATSAQADVIYDWHGDCTQGCTGQSTATITLLNYAPGTPLAVGFFGEGPSYLKLLELRDNVDHRVLPSWYPGIIFPHGVPYDSAARGVLPLNTGPGSLEISYIAGVFASSLDGTWVWGFDGQDAHEARGTGGTFTLQSTPTPLPSTLALMGLALVGLWRSRWA